MSTTAAAETTRTDPGPSVHQPDDDRAVRAIIATARQPRRLPARLSWLGGAASALLWWGCFFPLDWGPLGFLAPIPLLLLVRIEERPRHLYRAIYLTWLLATATSIFWMAANLPMVGGWLALSLYLALYPVSFLFGCRVATNRLRIPLVIAAPVLWTGLEFLRAHLLTGFSWYYLGHSQWQWTTLIQMSDLVGTYGVSFVVMCCAAAAALWVPERWVAALAGKGHEHVYAGAKTCHPAMAIVGALVLLAACLIYGRVRMNQVEFQPGPRIALIQSNFPSELIQTPSSPTAGEIWSRHNRLTAIAAQYQPDMVVWPESAFRWPLFAYPPGISDAALGAIAKKAPFGPMTAEQWRQHTRAVREQLGDLATQANAAMLIGSGAIEAIPGAGISRYNTAVFSKPEIGVVGRYDKQHRVIFGEYVPWTNVLPFLKLLSPYTASFTIDAGEGSVVFDYEGFRIAPVICFEDTVPHMIRRMVASANREDHPIDVLVTVSNDGWFHHSAEQAQHLITSLFRTVETRTPLARAANTGVSAVIDGNGQIVKPVAYLAGTPVRPNGESGSMYTPSGEFRQDVEAVLVANVPLDPRESLYVWWGDWFGGICGTAFCFVFAWGGLMMVFRKRRAS